MQKKKWHVLIVDDELRIGTLINKLIHWDEFNLECVDVVDNGEKAFEIIQSDRCPDIVLTVTDRRGDKKIMLEDTKAVIFDLDGTLVDSMWVWTAIDEDYIRKYHLNPPEDFHEAMEGMSYTETAQYFLKIFPELPHTVEEIKKEWYDMSVDKYTKEVTLKPGVKVFLEMLKEKGIRTGIATSNDRKLVEEFLKARQITDLFDTICTSCEVNKGKPAPDVYLKAAGQLGAEPSACLDFFRKGFHCRNL